MFSGMKIALTASLLSLLCGPLSAAAAADVPLFAGDATLEISLPIDFDRLCRPREEEECDFTRSTLRFEDGPEGWRSIPVEVKIRGGWRSLSRNCSAPLLWLRFDETEVRGTPFEGQSLLPLTTHCGKGLSLASLERGSKRADYEQFLLREYLAHRIYNLLSEYSLRTRLVRIAYPDPAHPDRRPAPHYAFLTEHFDALATRSGTQRLERGGFAADRLDAETAAVLALFQYLVGNTDWSIARERNTMLLQTAAGQQLPVPYDLDMSGLVDADYAGPAPGLPIEDVRERYFLGYCQPGTDWNALFDHFSAREEAIMGLVDEVPGLSRASRRTSSRYLRQFFSLLESAQCRNDNIMAVCQPWPPSGEDHTSPLTDGAR
jgi:hypothetical protein